MSTVCTRERTPPWNPLQDGVPPEGGAEGQRGGPSLDPRPTNCGGSGGGLGQVGVSVFTILSSPALWDDVPAD